MGISVVWQYFVSVWRCFIAHVFVKFHPFFTSCLWLLLLYLVTDAKAALKGDFYRISHQTNRFNDNIAQRNVGNLTTKVLFEGSSSSQVRLKNTRNCCWTSFRTPLNLSNNGLMIVQKYPTRTYDWWSHITNIQQIWCKRLDLNYFSRFVFMFSQSFHAQHSSGNIDSTVTTS